MTNLTPLNDNRPDATTTRLQAAFAQRAGATPREQVLALTQLASPRPAALATPQRSPASRPRPRLTSPYLRVA